MRRALFLPLLTVAVALLAAAVALAADPPAARTDAATDVGQTQATLNATVDPHGSATTVRFDLGTTTSYGLQSATKDAGAGSGPVTVAIPVQGMTANTTYHYRAVATSAAGTTHGSDLTFQTAAVPARPSVSTGGVRDVTMTAATLTGSVTPRSSATSYHFEYGATTSYGSSTPAADAGAGTRSVAASAPIDGLQAGRRYHYRLVAANGLGTTRGSDRSFVAAAYPTSATLAASSDPVTYGGGVTISGTLGGPKISGVRVRLQTTAFPFSSPFADTGNAVTSSSKGAYSFTLPAVTMTTRALVIADGAPPVLSRMVVIRSATRVGVLSVRRGGGRVVVSGRMTPATQAGVVSLQRRGSSGSWVPMGRARLAVDGRYELSFRQRRSGLTLRVVGVPHDGGGHVRGLSRELRVAARPPA